MSRQNTEIPGDVSVLGNVNVAVDANVNGNATVGHDLVVKGWLDAPNIKGAMKGIFATVEELKAAYPNPRPGWFAFVGNALPAAIWRVENGVWIDTGEIGGGVSPDKDVLDAYIEQFKKLIEEFGEGYDWANGAFLSRVADDVAKGRITFEQVLTAAAMAFLKDGAHFGEFISGMYAGKGARIDKDGNTEVESLRVRSFMEVMELIINRLSALEGDQLLTEGDTIERIEECVDGTFNLYLHPKYEGYFTAQAEHNVLKGIYNTLAQGGGQYYTSWMRVNTVNAAANIINVSVYADEDVPAGRNFPPVEMMRFARWGNQTDPRRQSCLYLSSTEGRIVKLTGVTKPIIDASNYGATFGTVPEFLLEMFPNIRQDQDYIYARGLFVQDLQQVDYQGRPVVTYVDRGVWQPGTTYYNEERNAFTGIYETSDVWHCGCKWRCMKTGTTQEPRWNATDWAMVEGNPHFTVDFAPVNTVFRPSDIDMRLDIIAQLYNQDVTADIADEDVVWTRYSEDADGNPRAASDNVWALRHANAGKSVRITTEDIDYNGRIPKVVRFTATVTLRDGRDATAAFTFKSI